MIITDTQILSYYYKGAECISNYPITISSITAAEFLLIHSKKPNKANYYPILPSMCRCSGHFFDSRKHASLGKHRTDQLLLNFGGHLPSFVEFGSIAISQIINEGLEKLYLDSICHLDKEVKKKLSARFYFLIKAKVQCLPVTKQIASKGMELLSKYLDSYVAKKKLRNTINDVLILATAIQLSSPLYTKDNQLRRFTAGLFGAERREQQPVGLVFDFSAPTPSDRRKLLESKGYINRGWQIIERRGC